MDGALIDVAKTTLSEAEVRAWRQETAAMMRAWRAEKEQLEAVVAQHNARLSVLKRKLEHATGLMEDEITSADSIPQRKAETSDAGGGSEEDEEEISHAAVIGAAICNALALTSGRGLRCAALRKEVNKIPAVHARLKDHPNRFYSNLNRMVGKKIAKKGKSYRLLVPDSPQGETGGVAPPASR